MTGSAASPRPLAQRIAKPLLLTAMPLLGLANQYLAERTAMALRATPFGWDWIGRAAHTPWVPAWIGLEVLTLTIWLTVLSEISLSAAFPMTAVGYILVVGMGWTLLGEPVNALEIVGGAAILIGVWLIGDDRAQAHPARGQS
jgi:drug/metabolite transporter (DMT)-like permease